MRLSKPVLAAIVIAIVVIAGAVIYKAFIAKPVVKEVKVGVILPLTGPASKEGWIARHGIELAIEHINRQGGVKSLGGAKLVPIFADSAGKPEVGMAEAERLITVEKVHVLTGCYQSAVTLPVAGVAEKYKIPFMVADAISDKITEQGYKYVFRVHGKASWYGRDAVKFIVDMNKKYGTDFKKIALVYEDDEFGKSSAEGFKKYLKQLAPGYEIVIEESYPLAAADLTPLVTKVKAADPDVVVHVAYVSDAILFFRAMKTLNWCPKVYLGLGAAGQAHHDFIKGLGKDAEYVFTQTEWQPDLLLSPKLKGFKWVNDEYRQKYGEDMVGISADCYSSTWVLYYAIEKAGSLDPDKIRDALASIVMDLPSKEVNVILPYTKIDLTSEGQNPHTAICVAQILEGKFRIVWPVEFATVEAKWPIPSWEERG
ncbi:MAG: ABC transporter substrate-binding protein [Thermoproteota archaeon]|nr:MAG: ABC transporter substrate-binding protein [Candidatus Korarchaeota archaeon]